MKEKYMISEKSQRVITFLGYWWVVFSVLFGIVQLTQWSFDYRITIWWVGLILFVVVLLISTGVALLLLFLFPHILDRVFKKLPDEKKYYNITPEDESTALKAIIYSSLSNNENDEMLVLPIKLMIKKSTLSNEDLMQALRIGLINSPIFHRLGKRLTRVINGCYTLLALDYAVAQQLIRITSDQYCYTKNYVLINDLGWSLSQLNDDEYLKLKKYIKSQNELKELCSKYDYLSFNKTQREQAISIIETAKEEIIDSGTHEKLLAQCFRHLISINTECYYTEENLNALTQTIKRIKNDDDKTEMEGNALYLRAVHMISALSLCISNKQRKETLEIALKYINSAQSKYEALYSKGTEKTCKCYNVRGKLYLQYSKYVISKMDYLRKASMEFEKGVVASKKILRYDQILINMLALSEMFGESSSPIFDSEKAKRYAKEGVSISKGLKNYEYEIQFLNYFKPKHIILLRHGESQKNIDRIINGEGPLTQYGKKTINKRSETINEYLLKYKLKDVKIYGYDKIQVQQTVNILKETLQINTDSCFYTNELKPIDMGILRQKKESDKSLTEYLAILEEWREQNVSADELSMLLEAESYGEYWKRAEKFISSVADNECTIVVCTTSVAILLTHYLIDPTYMPSQYAHIDIPLGGIIHFVETVDEGKFEITNKESKLNINYKKL